MTELQAKYVAVKAAYDEAFKMENWELVDQLEDDYIETEFALVEWSFEEVQKTGKMSAEECEMLRKNSNLEQWSRMVDLALRLAV